ncbi:MAG TPA: hypothetical protein VGF55_27205 [Gemmataceae bacterium]
MANKPINGILPGAAWVRPGPLGAAVPGARSSPATTDPCPTGPGNDTGGLRRVEWRLVRPREARHDFFTLNLDHDRNFLSKADGRSGHEPPDGPVVPVGETIDIQVACRGWFDVRPDCGSVLRVEPWPDRPKKDHWLDPGVRRYSVTGLRADSDTCLRAYTRRGRVLDYVRVAVKKRRSYAVKCWYLVNGDGQGGPGDVSRRSRAGLANLLGAANRYFVQQANTSFYDLNSAKGDITRAVKVGGEKPGEVRIRQLADPLTEAELRGLIVPEVTGGDGASVTAHVVFVWGKCLANIASGTGRDRSGLTVPGRPPVVLVQDECNNKDAKILAHELGHVLTYGHAAECHYVDGHSQDPTDLMFRDVRQDPNSMWIRLDEANVMNP